MKILWVTPKWTLPAIDGARVASKQLISSLTAEGLSIDYLSLSHPGDKIDKVDLQNELGVEQVFSIRRSLPRSLLEKLFFYGLSFIFSPSTPLTTTSFYTNNIKKKSHDIVEKGGYDFIVADGLHAIIPFLSLESRLIYRSHNVEYEIWRKAAEDTKNIFKKVFLYIQFFAMKSFENQVVNHVDRIFPISEDDTNIYKNKFKAEKFLTLPLGLEFDRLKRKNQHSSQIRYLFLGRLDWPPNRDGLIWLLENVWPSIDCSKQELVIAGSGDSNWVEKYQDMAGVKFLGFVDNLDHLYEEVDASLIPIFYGSGTRIKVIEAASKGVPIISTAMGTQGSGLIPNEDFLALETVDDWVSGLNNFDKSSAQALAESGFDRLKSELDKKNIAKKFIQKLS